MFPKTPGTSVYLVHERKNGSNIFVPLATPADHCHEASPCPASLALGHLTPAHHMGLPPARREQNFYKFPRNCKSQEKIATDGAGNPSIAVTLKTSRLLGTFVKRSSSRGRGNEHQHGRHSTDSVRISRVSHQGASLSHTTLRSVFPKQLIASEGGLTQRGRAGRDPPRARPDPRST